MKHAGSCLCGQVAFEVEGEFGHFFLCHCGHCRKDTGSAHAANLFSGTARLTWLSGEAGVSTFVLGGTRHQKSFCSTCGSAVPGIHADGTLVVPAGCLDSKAPMPVQAHIFMGRRAEWDNELDAVVSFEALPG